MVEGDLEITQNNMGIFSEMLTDLTPGKEHPEVTISIMCLYFEVTSLNKSALKLNMLAWLFILV